MKTTLSAFAVLIISASSFATPYFDNITNLWFTACHSNALAIANQRLAVNSNDIAGLLIKASWDFSFSNASVLSNSLLRVLEVGGSVRSRSFTNVFEITKVDIRYALIDLADETPAQRAEDFIKAARPGRLPHFVDDLKALDDDGFFMGNP